MRALKALALLLVLLLLPLPALGEEATYSIDVDCYNNIVTVYRASDGAVVRQMICSSGSGASPSPQGNYVMPEPYNRRERKEWYIFAEGYGKYASRIWGNYLFHSYLFNAEDDAAVNEESVISMGTNASHGCIRLYIEDARWISENCLPGTKVRLFWGSTQELYLKELLICDTFRLEDGVSYARFLGAAENGDEIGYGDTGEKVLSLQNTLISLGLYAGEADGTYGPEMVQTVRSLQTALNLPVTLPLWAAGVGCVFAIAVVKQLFGGLGQNFANPAITARVFLMLSLTSDMTNWILPRGKTLYFGYDAVSAATPLVNTDVSLQDLFWGAHGGCIGETCVAALLFGGMFLIFLGLVSPAIPGAYLGSFALCVLVYSGGDFHEMFYQLMAGGLMLGAFFMATDYVTSPVTTLGRILFGIGCGVLTFLIRYFGSFPEGVSLAILLMDILTPYLDRLTMPRPFGAAGKGDAA